MTELEKLEYTKSFIDKLADGINPLDDTPIPNGDLLNNVRLTRCMFYVSDILRQVIENGGVHRKVKSNKIPFSITEEQISKYDFEDKSISASEISKKLYTLAQNDNMVKLTYKDITLWLLNCGMLTEKIFGDNKVKKCPTEQGEKIGIFMEHRVGMRGEYDVVLYNKEAQQFILDNIEAIIENKQHG